MDAAKYFIRGVTLLATDPGLQEALSRVYESSERPRCMCVRGGVEMYIAKHGEYVVKRMPGTGDMHHPTCQSFEPEPGLSGLGELVGEAIVEHNADHVEIRTDFPFSRVSVKAMPRGEAKYLQLVELCRRYGVLTPEDPYEVFDDGATRYLIAPLFTLYDYSFCPPGMTVAQALDWALAAGLQCTDEHLLFPDPYPSREDWCAARCAYSEARLTAALQVHPRGRGALRLVAAERAQHVPERHFGNREPNAAPGGVAVVGGEASVATLAARNDAVDPDRERE